MFTVILLASSMGAPPQFSGENKIPCFTGENKMSPGDPYLVESYADFYRQVEGGVKGILIVGVKDRYVQTYQIRCVVPSGFSGFADGEYDCYLENGQNTMKLREGVSQKASPFDPRSGIMPATVVRTADGRSSQSMGSTRTGLITIGAPTMAQLGGTSYCPPSG
jgi:hypothetical protein